ncbi:MAG: thioredoxin domain-containing protein [Chlamydiia bacterium]|nr:thioredoxin domain-containing protein [Chlamydiia bacterium]
MAEEHKYTNRLIDEKSPYLLQHAHNPVDWYPWGEEAFEAAKNGDKPIFLSIGYATCHWCHVMERESFEDEAIAKLMNETFINIKVDREELPEVDSLYMEFAQGIMTGAAGWPLNLVLTPALEPFFASTYLPPEPRQGMIGMPQMIQQIAELWQSDKREAILQQASRIVEIFASQLHTHGDKIPDQEIIDNAVDLYVKVADPVYGGLKGDPKFPIPYQNQWMIRYGTLHNESRSLFLSDTTLEMMYRGGIYDHIGGGFYRYSVAEQWIIAHFEKMLYDNALLADGYLEGWLATKKPLFRAVCQEICDYVLRDMTQPQGGFFAAEDAESEGKEGAFLTWTAKEVNAILGQDSAALFCQFYNISPQGNFDGRNVLHMTHSLEQFAVDHKLDPHFLAKEFASMRDELFHAREKRPHPLKDDKILCGWNGMMCHTLIRAGAVLQQKRYLVQAKKTLKFIVDNLFVDGKLLRRWREGHAGFSGGLDEHVHLIRAFITLFEVEGDSQALKSALELTAVVEQEFKALNGAFFQSAPNEGNLILRKCLFADGAEPSGNAIHCENLLRLHQITGESKYLQHAEDIFRATTPFLDQYSLAYCYHLMNLQWYYHSDSRTFVIPLNSRQEGKEEIQELLFSTYEPHRAIVWLSEETKPFLPHFKDQGLVDGEMTVYPCFRGRCEKPAVGLQAIAALFNN